MTKPGRPTALAALLLACALAAAGSVSHGHDDGHSGGDDHHCAICSLRHSPATPPPAPAPSAPDLATHAAAPSCRQTGCDATLATQAPRGPPA